MTIANVDTTILLKRQHEQLAKNEQLNLTNATSLSATDSCLLTHHSHVEASTVLHQYYQVMDIVRLVQLANTQISNPMEIAKFLHKHFQLAEHPSISKLTIKTIERTKICKANVSCKWNESKLIIRHFVSKCIMEDANGTLTTTRVDECRLQGCCQERRDSTIMNDGRS